MWTRRMRAGFAGRHQPQRKGRAARAVLAASCGARSRRWRCTCRRKACSRGDRVAAYLPNIPEAIVAFLAVASIGGVWSICAPDMGTNAVLDRFRQIEPKVLIACDGVTYGGRDFDRTGVVAELRAALPSVQHLLVHRNLGAGDAALQTLPPWTDLAQAIARDDDEAAGLRAAVAAVRPSAVDRLFQRHHRPAQAHRARPWRHRDRGTRAQGAAQRHRLQLRAQQLGRALPLVQLHRLGDVERAGRAACSTARPAASTTATRAAPRTSPTGRVLWRFAADLGVTFFGAGAAFFANCMKAGVELSACGDLCAGARAGHHRLAAVARKCSAGARSSLRGIGDAATSGGATSPAAPTSRAPSSAATASCRRCPARCSAACSAAPSRPGTNRASR